MKQSKKPYIIDTNILISFRIFTPMDIHRQFWKQLSDVVANKSIIIIEDVADECKDNKISSWVRKQRVEKVPDSVRERAFEINNKYPLITQEGEITKSEADPVIVAYAEEYNGIVFTHEAGRKSNDQPMKIPDVCEALSIECQRWPDRVFEDIKFKPIGTVNHFV